jgi:hypothetical protein
MVLECTVWIFIGFGMIYSSLLINVFASLGFGLGRLIGVEESSVCVYWFFERYVYLYMIN